MDPRHAFPEVQRKGILQLTYKIIGRERGRERLKLKLVKLFTYRMEDALEDLL